MNQDEQRLHWKNLILQQSTGELSPEEEATLMEAMQSDPSLAAFSHSVQHLTPSQTRAPRDFAAEAISLVYPVPAPQDFSTEAIQKSRTPRRLPTAVLPWAFAAAAVIALFFSIAELTRSTPEQSGTERRTAAISAQLDAIEGQLASPTRNHLRQRTRPAI